MKGIFVNLTADNGKHKHNDMDEDSYVNMLTHQTPVYLEHKIWSHGGSVQISMYYQIFNATFNNISAISWRPVLVVEEAGVPGENHRPWPSNW